MYVLDKVTKPEENTFVKEATKSVFRNMNASKNKKVLDFIADEQLSLSQWLSLCGFSAEEEGNMIREYMEEKYSLKQN